MTDTSITGSAITDKTNAILSSEDVKNHPFSFGIGRHNVENVLSNYLAMSISFPYLQAGASYPLLKRCLDNGVDVDASVEVTSVVGAFLTWDEFGGHATVQARGNVGLPHILETGSFHANLLRSDIERLLGKPLQPTFSSTTRKYLLDLYDDLSATDAVLRCASMVAFEAHAERMIDALWKSLETCLEADKDSLTYFATHVGGDDPAEQYHVQMTSKMIERIVDTDNIDRFISCFEEAYKRNIRWCEEIKLLPG